MSTWDPERIAKLRLARTHGVGPLTFQKLLRSRDTAVEALEALPERAKKGWAS